MDSTCRIHPSATVMPGAKLGKNVSVGAFSTVYGGAEIGDESVIEPFCSIGIGPELENSLGKISLGQRMLVRSHSVLYANSKFGDRVQIGHHSLVRSGTTISDDASIGSFSDVEGDCFIGAGSRIHSGCHISKGTQIGKFVWIFPNVVFTNDPYPPSGLLKGVTVHDYAVIASAAVLLPGVTIFREAVVGAGAVVSVNVDAGQLVSAAKVRKAGPAAHLPFSDELGTPPYPWQLRGPYGSST